MAAAKEAVYNVKRMLGGPSERHSRLLLGKSPDACIGMKALTYQAEHFVPDNANSVSMSK